MLTLGCRLASVAALLSLWWNGAAADAAVAALYSWLRGTWWFRHDTFEPMLATM